MKKFIIGLDLGINNVGWSVINLDTNEIVDYGVVRYTESSDAQDRRGYRSVRRLRNRRLHRIERLALLFNKYNLPTTKTIENNLLQKRIDGLNSELSWQEIVNIIYYFATHRGYIPFNDEKNERETVNLEENQYPCHFIMDEYKKYGKYRNANFLIKFEDNINELKAMLGNQSKYHSFLTDILINDILKIVNNKRSFYEGPGGPREDQLTPYGRYTSIEDLDHFKKDFNYNKYLYEKLIGKCNIALNEPRAPKWNYFAEEFNFLNDFINIKVKTEFIGDIYPKKVNEHGKLTRETILEIKQYILTKDVIKIDSLFNHILGLKIDAIDGYRYDKNKQPEFSKFEFYKYIAKQFKNANLKPKWLDDKDIYNKVIYVLTVAPSSLQLEEMLKDRVKIHEFSNEEIDVLKLIKTKKVNELNSYHSLSEKVLKRVLIDMDQSNYQLNYMQIKQLNYYEKESDEFFQKNYTLKTKSPYYLEIKYIDELITNPQVKKTLRKALKVINAMIKKYQNYPTIIAIESTREMNSKSKREEIIKTQKVFEDRRKEAKSFLENNGISVNETNIIKSVLYQETDGHCIYCNKPIPISNLSSLEIEHILPISHSFDDSFDNLSCSCLKCNKEKGNLTPYYFLNESDYDKFKQRVLSGKFSAAKKDNLLFENDISKYELKFINRNLRDVAYGTIALCDEIRRFNKFLNNKDEAIKIVTIPGQLTSKIRHRVGLDEKDRSKLFHHAVDATIIASIANTKIGGYLINLQNDRDYWFKNKKELEILPYLIQRVDIDNIDVIKKINEDNIKKSYDVNKDPEKTIANANVIKILNENNQFYKVQQIPNIYNLDIRKDGSKLDQLFDETNTNRVLLCQRDDPKLFLRLKTIYNTYKNTNRNPFRDYCLYEFGIETDENQFNYLIHGIRKSPDKKNSPIVKTLRFKERITNPYILEKKTNRKNNAHGAFLTPENKRTTIIGLDSLSQYCTDLYFSKTTNRFIFVPVYTVSVDLNEKKINRQEKYYVETYNRLIGNQTIKFIGTLFNNEWCEVYKKNDTNAFEGRYVCYHKTNNLLIFGIKGSYESNETFNMTTLDKRIIIYSTDILGKRYKRLDSQDFI